MNNNKQYLHTQPHVHIAAAAHPSISRRSFISRVFVGLELFFPPSCSFIYPSSYLEVTALVNIVSACVVRSVAASSLFLMAPLSLRWPFVMSVCARSSAPAFGKLLFCLLHLRPV